MALTEGLGRLSVVLVALAALLAMLSLYLRRTTRDRVERPVGQSRLLAAGALMAVPGGAALVLALRVLVEAPMLFLFVGIYTMPLLVLGLLSVRFGLQLALGRWNHERLVSARLLAGLNLALAAVFAVLSLRLYVDDTSGNESIRWLVGSHAALVDFALFFAVLRRQRK